MTYKQLVKQIYKKGSFLCVGLDTDIEKIPKHLRTQPDAIFRFNKKIIDATKDYCVAYKINTAFYEALGLPGWKAMEKTVNYIPSTHFKIADAKRGDIGNTSAQYAKAFFKTMNFDAITVAPYMGEDSIQPFLEYKNKWTIILGLTSNKGAENFEMQKVMPENISLISESFAYSQFEGVFLYEKVLYQSSRWGSKDNLMFVVGATQAAELANIRKIIPDNFLLVPGVGAQGGSLEDVAKYGMTKDCGLLVNVSRDIIYAGSKADFAEKAKEKASEYQKKMGILLK